MDTIKNPKQVNPEKFIDSLYQRRKISKSVNPNQFWRNLTKRFGALAEELGDTIDARANGILADPYKIKNQSIEFADAVFAQFDRDKIKAFAAWILRAEFDMREKKILEIGCDNGVLLTLLAEIFPEAEFTGVDSCEEAISIATKRSIDLGLKNVTFKKCGAEDCQEAFQGPGFDMVIATVFFLEFLANLSTGPDHGCMSLSGYNLDSTISFDQKLASENRKIEHLDSVASLLKNHGLLISLDRWTDHYLTLKWVRYCERSGLSLDIKKSWLLNFLNAERVEEVLPLTVFRKEKAQTVSCSDFLSFYCYSQLARLHITNEVKNDLLAEVIYLSLNTTKLAEVTLDYINGSGIETREAGLAGPVGYFYRRTTRGLREIHLIPATAIQEQVHIFFAVPEALLNSVTVVRRILNEEKCRELQIGFE
jgi:SAM-dependent methyltransferase